MGPKNIDLLLEHGVIATAPDIFELERGDLEGLPRMGERSITNMLEAIDRARQVSLARLLYALSIDLVGEETAILIAEKYGSLEGVAAASRESLESIPGVGEKVAQSVFDWFQDKNNQQMLERLLREIKIESPKTKVQTAGFFTGKTVVLTGSLENFTREEVVELIRSEGGSVSGSVSKRTDFVIVGENPGSKLIRAEELGIEILREDDLIRIKSQQKGL